MARAASADQIADHARDHRKHDPRPRDTQLNFSQKLALAKMIGYCEGVARSGILPEDCEFKLREIIATTLVEFGMPSSRERADA